MVTSNKSICSCRHIENIDVTRTHSSSDIDKVIKYWTEVVEDWNHLMSKSTSLGEKGYRRNLYAERKLDEALIAKRMIGDRDRVVKTYMPD